MSYYDEPDYNYEDPDDWDPDEDPSLGYWSLDEIPEEPEGLEE